MHKWRMLHGKWYSLLSENGTLLGAVAGNLREPDDWRYVIKGRFSQVFISAVQAARALVADLAGDRP
jgi:hypothetical protein